MLGIVLGIVFIIMFVISLATFLTDFELSDFCSIFGIVAMFFCGILFIGFGIVSVTPIQTTYHRDAIIYSSNDNTTVFEVNDTFYKVNGVYDDEQQYILVMNDNATPNDYKDDTVVEIHTKLEYINNINVK